MWMAYCLPSSSRQAYGDEARAEGLGDTLGLGLGRALPLGEIEPDGEGEGDGEGWMTMMWPGSNPGHLSPL